MVREERSRVKDGPGGASDRTELLEDRCPIPLTDHALPACQPPAHPVVYGAGRFEACLSGHRRYPPARRAARP